MGLDAVVPCRCFEDGLLADPPAGIGELVRTPYGELAVKAFEEEGLNDQTAASFSPGAQDALRRFNEWAKAPCAHKWGYAWAEQIGNWASVREFRSLVGLLGGRARYPHLDPLLPLDNEGCLAVDRMPAVRAELEDFCARVMEAQAWALVADGYDEPLFYCVDADISWWRSYYPPGGVEVEVLMDSDAVVFIEDGGTGIATRRFVQVWEDPSDQSDKRPVRIEFLDRRGTVHLPSPLIHGQRDRVECRVECRTAPFLDDGEYWAGKRLMEGIDAALAVGQPMYWR